jgi:hypothetical protein
MRNKLSSCDLNNEFMQIKLCHKGLKQQRLKGAEAPWYNFVQQAKNCQLTEWYADALQLWNFKGWIMTSTAARCSLPPKDPKSINKLGGMPSGPTPLEMISTATSSWLPSLIYDIEWML